MNDRVKSVLSGILADFENGNIPKKMALVSFPIPNIPSAQWSMTNRILQLISDTSDGRGIRQWNFAGRKVKKGSHAFHIFVPHIIKKDDEVGEKDSQLVGFMLRPVFRVEDTEGAPLDYQQIQLPEMPLAERAEQLGLSVEAIPGNFEYYGYYASSQKKIALASPEEAVFFHELAHAAHDILVGGLRDIEKPIKEIVAELSAQALCYLVGKDGSKHLGNTYRYIAEYAQKLEITPESAVLRVMSETEKVLDIILTDVPVGVPTA